jgi:hypothetical protein
VAGSFVVTTAIGLLGAVVMIFKMWRMWEDD